VVLERLDQPLAVDLPLMREIRATLSKCIENGRDKKAQPYPELDATYGADRHAPPVLRRLRPRQPRPAARGHHRRHREHAAHRPQKKMFYLSIDFLHDKPFTPKQELYQQTIRTTIPR
jgi:pyruvate-ferredoxin/flavodoxin oxidoreductase